MPKESRNSAVDPSIVAGSIASSKLALAETSVATSVAPSTGVRLPIVGGVVSGTSFFSKETSTR